MRGELSLSADWNSEREQSLAGRGVGQVLLGVPRRGLGDGLLCVRCALLMFRRMWCVVRSGELL